MQIETRIVVSQIDQGRVEVELEDPYVQQVGYEDIEHLAIMAAKKAWAAVEAASTKVAE